jgi:CRP-like cAMP-binding protein
MGSSFLKEDRHSEHALALLVRKLRLSGELEDDDGRALHGLPMSIRSLGSGHPLALPHERRANVFVVRSGLVARATERERGRHIVALYFPGDVAGLDDLANQASGRLEAVVASQIQVVDGAALLELAANRASISMALWRSTLIETAITREWLINIATRTARPRLCHFLCECAVRLREAGLGSLSRFRLPLTQHHLGEVLGLTAVHINRTLKGLSDDGLVERRWWNTEIRDWDRLAALAGFEPDYLNLPDVPALVQASAFGARHRANGHARLDNDAAPVSYSAS